MNNFLGRAIIFLIAGAGCILSMQYAAGHFKGERQLILLNRTRPDFHHFLDVEKNPSLIPKEDLTEYFDYFRLVTEAMPGNSDGTLMLGHLYMITGNKDQAGVLLKESYGSDPQFFFTGFNLALVFFDQGDYSQSALLLQKALATPPQSTLNHMMNSLIYRQIFSSMDDSRDIIIGLQQAYHDADVLLMEALAKQKGLQGENAGPQVHAHIM